MIGAAWPKPLSTNTQAWLERAAWFVALTAALGPLELRDATVAVAGLTVSSVELLAGLAIGTSLFAMVALHRDGALRTRLSRPLIGALIAWAALHVASALWSDEPLYSLKFGLRVSGGVGLAIACATLGHLRRFRRIVAGGILAGMAVITTIAIAERALGRSLEPFLQLFRDEPTWMLGEPRLSTVFYHANTLAAYLELTLPFLLVVPWLSGVTRRQRWFLLTWAVVCGAMLSLTYSRAGLLAGVLASLTLAWAARRGIRQPQLAKTALIFGGLLSVAFLANPDMRARLGMGKREYRVRYDFGGPCEGRPAEEVEVPLVVVNEGEWPISDRHAPGELGYLIWPRAGKPHPRAFRYDDLPTLGRDTQHATVLRVHLPDRPGKWPLVVDIRRKGVVWLSAVGTKVGRTTCTVVAPVGWVKPPPSGAKAMPIKLQGRPLEMSRRHYWQAATRLLSERPLLGHGADRFRMSYGRFVPKAGWDGRARAHSVIMETAANLGLAGLALLGLLLGLIGANALPNLLGSRGASPIATAASVALVGFGLHALVDYFLGYTQILLIAWPIVGLATMTEAKEADDDKADE
ncbi:MAG: O-antigen ligase family protein [Myxococcales bacterium]|nr:O-antigen ligase family protein [Myxococcales bacterium]